MGSSHTPVMVAEVLRALDVKEGHVVVDCTAGGGGHLARFAESVGAAGKVVALDRDPRAHQDDAAGGVAKRFAPRVVLVQRPFSEVRAALDDAGVARCDALFADLGVSSFQLDDFARGFSFRATGADDAALDMRMDPTRGETAHELIERLDEEELANVIFELGDERKSRRIARAIKRVRPTTTAALASTVAGAMGARGYQKIHPATRTFQALRIAVNTELDELDALLLSLTDVVRGGGRCAILSFHSLEDRRVKVCFRGEGFSPLSRDMRKPLVPSDEETQRNPRSRSAKLRVAVVGAAL